MIKTDQVFGVSNKILKHSYVDRGDLDIEIVHKSSRPCHMALCGESKIGKSWIRQQNFPDAITVQCRLNTVVVDIYTDILSQLGIKLLVEETKEKVLKGRVEASAEAGASLLAKLKIKLGIDTSDAESLTSISVGHDINDLMFVAEIIKSSGKRIVVEDFHYLSIEIRRKFSFDLKYLWDHGVFIVVVGVWAKSNMITYLNPDLAGRIEEIPVSWSSDDLYKVIERGSDVLNIEISRDIQDLAVRDSYRNVGLLQQLILQYLDEEKVFHNHDGEDKKLLGSLDKYNDAAMKIAEQLSKKYQKFADDVSSGIRRRKDTTGIYGHAMAVILDSVDDDFIKGLPLQFIFDKAVARQSRIQKQNLRTVLTKMEGLQVDEDGRGLVFSFNEATEEVSLIDKTLLFYRKYGTLKWPWEDLIAEATAESAGNSTNVD
ncbi:hypothetical protein [Thalassospira australica]|uniref:hypothetical protein n=1 Tax=Thalassospira australica TaxID=1528106 RepID=UPI00384B013E